jgi:hypothetical protein
MTMRQPWIVDRSSVDLEMNKVLDEFGVAIIPDALCISALASLSGELDGHFRRAEFCKGLFYGQKTKRLGGVLKRSKSAQALALNNIALGAARAALGADCQELQLNLSQAIEIWPGSLAQVPHRDQDIWLGARHSGEMMMNAMWAIDDFTEQNGATRIWPRSHRHPDLEISMDNGIAAEMPKGSLCLFLGSTLHAGGANWSSAPRRGLVISYCLGWLKPCENPWLTYPPEVAKDFTPELSRLIGYRQDAPNLNNVEGRCPSELLDSGSRRERFVETLTDEQRSLILAFNEMQVESRARAA